MSTKVYEFSGETLYAKVYGEGDKEYKNWNLPLILDKPSEGLFDQSGLRLQRSKIPDGREQVKFRRDHEKIIGKDTVKFDAPKVFESDGVTPFTQLLGNGSVVIARVAVYDTKKFGKGHRLESIRVIKHVEYLTDNKSFDTSKMEAIRPDNALPPV